LVGPISGRVIVDHGKCTLCGKCVELCPCGALGIEGGRVEQKGYCMACMGCVVVCPAKAIRVEIARDSFRIVEVTGVGLGLEKYVQKRQPSSSSD